MPHRPGQAATPSTSPSGASLRLDRAPSPLARRPGGVVGAPPSPPPSLAPSRPRPRRPSHRHLRPTAGVAELDPDPDSDPPTVLAHGRSDRRRTGGPAHDGGPDRQPRVPRAARAVGRTRSRPSSSSGVRSGRTRTRSSRPRSSGPRRRSRWPSACLRGGVDRPCRRVQPPGGDRRWRQCVGHGQGHAGHPNGASAAPIDLDLAYRPDLVKGEVTGSLTGAAISPTAAAYAVAVLIDPATGQSLGMDLLPTVGAVPVPFSFPFPLVAIDPARSYLVGARIVDAERTWQNEAGVPVISRGNPIADVQVVVAEAVVPARSEPRPSSRSSPAGGPGGDLGPGIVLLVLALIVGAAGVLLYDRSRSDGCCALAGRPREPGPEPRTGGDRLSAATGDGRRPSGSDRLADDRPPGLRGARRRAARASERRRPRAEATPSSGRRSPASRRRGRPAGRPPGRTTRPARRG